MSSSLLCLRAADGTGVSRSRRISAMAVVVLSKIFALGGGPWNFIVPPRSTAVHPCAAINDTSRSAGIAASSRRIWSFCGAAADARAEALLVVLALIAGSFAGDTPGIASRAALLAIERLDATSASGGSTTAERVETSRCHPGESPDGYD